MPNRREFLSTTAAAAMGYWVAGGAEAKESRSPNERIAFASIGIDGKGDSDSDDAGRAGDIVAICDVDDQKLGKAGQHRFPKAKKFNDFREMLDEMGKSIDAVTVSTPDHIHAVAAAMAMKMKKHCFVQKPLTHSIYEARVLGQFARENEVATQMGNQGTANGGLRKAAAAVQAGVLGTVKEVHVWTNRPIWPQGGNAPRRPSRPQNLHWDLWLGPAPTRPLWQRAYHPFAWRGWWDFGTGALGDMACHTLNMPFMALDLRDPISVQAETSGHNKDSYPKWSIITFEFPATDKRPAVKVFWYDGGKRPPAGPVRRREDATSPARCWSARRASSTPPATTAADFECIGDAKARRSTSSIRPATSRMRPRDQGRRAGRVELPRLRRPADRNDPAGQPGRVGRRLGQGRKGRVGRQESQGQEHQRAGADRAAHLPQGIFAVKRRPEKL